MAYLNKEQYSRRAENAAKRNADNAESAMAAGMSEKDAELIIDLCRIRHEIHSNIDHLVNDGQYNFLAKDLMRIWEGINRADGTLPGFDLGDYGANIDLGYIDIDDFNELYEIGNVPEDDDEKKAWHDENYSRIYGDWSNVNTMIEKYLKMIDEKFGTSFEPTGKQRLY